MSRTDEYQIRQRAVELYEAGTGFNKILKLVGRSDFWLCKWLDRYGRFGDNGLRDRSRRPQHSPRKTRDWLRRKILALRDELEAHRTGRAYFAGISAGVIHYELLRQGVRRLPSISTIEKILAREGKTRKAKVRRLPGGPPYPYVPARVMGDLHQTDLIGPRHLRGPRSLTRFFSFHTIDVAGKAFWTSQFSDKQARSLCRHLVDSWRFLGLPRASQLDNEMAACGGARYRYTLSQVIRLHLLLGIHIYFIPRGEPGRNADVESFNCTYQDSVLRHRCPDLRSLRTMSRRFHDYAHYQKPCRKLSLPKNGTRLPGVLRNRLWPSLPHLPQGFSLDRYVDSRGNLALPIAKGKVSFTRKVDERGSIEILGVEYFIRRSLERQYVVATLSTHHRRLFIYHDKKFVKTVPFPFKGDVVEPLS